MKIQTEKSIENAFVRMSRKRGMLALKLSSDDTKGFPDRTVLRFPGCVFFVEFKRLGMPLEPHQRVWCKTFKVLGLRYYVVDSVEGIRSVLDAEA